MARVFLTEHSNSGRPDALRMQFSDERTRREVQCKDGGRI